MVELIFTLSTIFFFGMFLILVGTMVVSGIFFLRNSRRNHWATSSFEPGVTVLIPAYNEGKNIRGCVDAVLACEYPKQKMEIMVVDDGSTDDTLQILSEYPQVKVLKQNHKGKVAALNFGISKATHDYIVTIDADTYIEKNGIKEIVKPFIEQKVGAVSGIANVKNNRSLLGVFQSIEYVYISFLREAFSNVFRVAPGICGAFTCYKKSVLNLVGGFSKATELEDFDISLHVVKSGHHIVTSPKALSYTVVPGTFKDLFIQRVRWLKGSMQCVVHHADFWKTRKMSINYILASQIFWFVYAFFALPLMLFHIFYWLPFNSATLFEAGFYFFRWISLAGIAYWIYMIPQWGVNITYLFGVLAGIVSALFYAYATFRYDRTNTLKKALGIFFYFPYTLLLSAMMVGGAFSYFKSGGKGTFIKK